MLRASSKRFGGGRVQVARRACGGRPKGGHPSHIDVVPTEPVTVRSSHAEYVTAAYIFNFRAGSVFPPLECVGDTEFAPF